MQIMAIQPSELVISQLAATEVPNFISAMCIPKKSLETVGGQQNEDQGKG